MRRDDFHMTILEALSTLKQAWYRVTERTTANCFKKASFTPLASSSKPSDEPRSEDDVPQPFLSRLQGEWNISGDDYFNVDDDLQTASPETASGTDCPQSTMLTATGSDDSASDDDCDEPETNITRKVLLDCMQKTNLYCMQTCAACGSLLPPFRAFGDALHKHLSCAGNQTTIPQFIQKTDEHGQDMDRRGSMGEEGYRDKKNGDEETENDSDGVREERDMQVGEDISKDEEGHCEKREDNEEEECESDRGEGDIH